MPRLMAELGDAQISLITGSGRVFPSAHPLVSKPCNRRWCWRHLVIFFPGEISQDELDGGSYPDPSLSYPHGQRIENPTTPRISTISSAAPCDPPHRTPACLNPSTGSSPSRWIAPSMGRTFKADDECQPSAESSSTSMFDRTREVSRAWSLHRRLPGRPHRRWGVDLRVLRIWASRTAEDALADARQREAPPSEQLAIRAAGRWRSCCRRSTHDDHPRRSQEGGGYAGPARCSTSIRSSTASAAPTRHRSSRCS